MKRNAREAAERLRRVLLTDKIAHPEKLTDLLCNDIGQLLENYFVLRPASVAVRFAEDGDSLIIEIDARAARIKPFGEFK